MHDVNKKSVMVYLDPKIVAKARELGLNISKTCENALKMAIEELGEFYKENKPENCKKCGGWDSNPRRPTPAGLKPAPFSRF